MENKTGSRFTFLIELGVGVILTIFLAVWNTVEFVGNFPTVPFTEAVGYFFYQLVLSAVLTFLLWVIFKVLWTIFHWK